jgi:hypothetical protein
MVTAVGTSQLFRVQYFEVISDASSTVAAGVIGVQKRCHCAVSSLMVMSHSQNTTPGIVGPRLLSL